MKVNDNTGSLFDLFCREQLGNRLKYLRIRYGESPVVQLFIKMLMMQNGFKNYCKYFVRKK